MIYQPLSSLNRTVEVPLAAGVQLSSDGQAMVSLVESGRLVVRPSAGAAGEVFYGFSNIQTHAAPVVPTTAVRVEALVPDAAGNMTAAIAPLAGSVLITNASTGAVVASTGLTNRTVSVAASNAGVSLHVTYRYTLSVAQATALKGDLMIGGYVGNAMGQTSVAREGVIYTSQFDSSKDYAAATSLKLAAGGQVTDQSGTGETISAVVKQVPTVDYPFLGISFKSLV